MKKNLLFTLVLALFAWAGVMAGTGTVTDPFTVAEVITAYGSDNNVPAETYVFGYIVGGRYDDFDYNSNEYAFSLADVATEADIANCMQVKLSTDQRAVWSPKNDNSLIGKMVIVSGSGDGYGTYIAVESNVTIEFYNSSAEPVVAPVISNLLPESGSVYLVGDTVRVYASAATEDAGGIDSVKMAFGFASSALTDTATMDLVSDSTYHKWFVFDGAASVYGQVIAYGNNGEITKSSITEVIGQVYNEFAMTTSQYQIIVDTVNARGLNTATYNETIIENYFGAGSAYSNFDAAADGSYDTLVFASYNEAIEEALSTVLLPAVRFNAEVNDTFAVSYALYKADESTGSMTFECTSTDPLIFALYGGASALKETSVLEFNIYPNPASTFVQFNQAVDAVEFVSLSGRTMLSRYNVAANTSLDVSSLSSGIYLVKVNAKESVAVRKLVIQ